MNAAADLHTRAGHLLPRTQRYSDAHDCRWEGWDTELLWNMREGPTTTTTLPVRISRQPSTRKLGEKEDRPNSWAERARGLGQLQKDTQSSDPADSTHRTNQGRDWRGSIHWREQILTGWGATRGVNWRCTNISCDLSLNGNLRGNTRVAYSVNVSEFISLLLSLVRWLVICYLERQMETGESEYIDG